MAAARILIVEDNPTNLALMAYLLKAFGYQVATAVDGRMGVDSVLADPPDLVLMDLQLPVLNGTEALRAIRDVPSLARLPVIAVTALAMVGDRERVRSQGFDGYISKPIAAETFVSDVEAFLPASLHSGVDPRRRAH